MQIRDWRGMSETTQGGLSTKRGSTKSMRRVTSSCLIQALEIFERLGTLVKPDKVRKELGELAHA